MELRTRIMWSHKALSASWAAGVPARGVWGEGVGKGVWAR